MIAGPMLTNSVSEGGFRKLSIGIPLGIVTPLDYGVFLDASGRYFVFENVETNQFLPVNFQYVEIENPFRMPPGIVSTLPEVAQVQAPASNSSGGIIPNGIPMTPSLAVQASTVPAPMANPDAMPAPAEKPKWLVPAALVIGAWQLMKG